MTFNEFILANEVTIRLSFFFGVFAIMALWEVLAPRRALTVSKTLRWVNNLGLVFFNSFILRLLFPAAAVGVAAFAQTNGWGLLNYYQLPVPVAIILAVIAMDFIIYLQHVMVHAVPLLWRIHRVHHSVEDDEPNSNFGFNLTWWDRLFGTYHEQPRGGQLGFTIGIHKYHDIKQTNWITGVMILPFKVKVSEYAINTINTRSWSSDRNAEQKTED